MYHDDNFGEWEGMEPGHPDYEDNVAFYRQVQDESVEKECSDCGHTVMLRPDYCRCNSCCERIERGYQY
mgnify:CR=1 FL=1